MSPFAPVVLKVARAFVVGARYARALQWLKVLDPERLQTDEFLLKDRDGKERKLASQRERYYSIKTHALEKLGQWQECLDSATEALARCAPFHHDNDVWFGRRAARAKINLGACEVGIAELEQLAKRKATFFIFADIADAAWRLNDSERTTDYSLRALNSAGDIGFRLAAVLLLGRVLWCTSRHNEAREHLEFCLAYRNTKGWKVSLELKDLAKEWGIDPAPSASDWEKRLRQLKTFWRRWSEERNPRQMGVVHRLLPHGRAGFIISSDNQRFYFDARDWVERRTRPTQGARVSFSTKPSFDRKHQRATVVACDVRTAGVN